MQNITVEVPYFETWYFWVSICVVVIACTIKIYLFKEQENHE